MKKKIVVRFLWIILFLLISLSIYLKFFNTKKINQAETNEEELGQYNSNIIKDVQYISRDAKGNQYIINAKIGEIDFSNNDIIYLTDVNAIIKLNNSNNITITSDFGKYNTENFDTIFSQNVIINYLDNKITGEYLDFSIDRNSMIISRNVIYTNIGNILKADVIEVNIETKDTKIFMYNKENKVNVKNKN